MEETIEKRLLKLQEDITQEVKESDEGVNKIITLVNTGIFALSVNFISLNSNSAVYPKLLVVAWVSVVVNLLGKMFWYIDKQITLRSMFNLQQKLKDISDEEFDKEMRKINASINRLPRYGWIITGALIVGVISIIAFATINFIEQNEAKKREEAKNELKEQVESELRLLELAKMRGQAN